MVEAVVVMAFMNVYKRYSVSFWGDCSSIAVLCLKTHIRRFRALRKSRSKTELDVRFETQLQKLIASFLINQIINSLQKGSSSV
jgi:hypothetical protein